MTTAGGDRVTTPERIVIASRQSELALWQARHIQAQLARLYPAADIPILGMTTEGDRRPEVSLQQVGGKGLFVKELEEALLDGRADLAVHSLKDVPMALAPELALAAIGERADPRDAFVSRRYRSPAGIPPGSRIGTSSLRRASQLRARYPQLRIEPLRGNVPTRLARLDRGDYEAIVVAAAGLKRLGLEDRITLILTPEECLPAPGQGALALECRAERSDLKAWLAPLHHAATAVCVAAERSFSRSLAGSCNVPLGAYAELAGARLRLRGLVAQPDGARIVRGEAEGDAGAPEALGRSLAAHLEAQGAGDILAVLANTGGR
jgi:hydroxymethylbilane synthase